MPVTNGKLILTLDASGFESTLDSIPDHSSQHESGASDEIKLDALGTPTDSTTLDATTSRHGLLPKLSGSSTQFLNGNGAWSTPTGGAGLDYPGSSSVFLTGAGTWASPSVLHASTHKDGGNDLIRLDELAAPTTTARNVSITAPGLVPTLPGSKKYVLDGTGSFSSIDTIFGTRGSATITSGNTSVTVTHNLSDTPYAVILTPTSLTGSKDYYVSAKTSSTFTITINSAYASNISFDWAALGVTESGTGGGTLPNYLYVGSGKQYATDGTADDVQIQAAIDAASSGDVVYMPDTTYDITQPVDMAEGVVLKGAGVASTQWLIPTASLDNFNVDSGAIIYCTGISNAEICGFKMDGNDGIYDHRGVNWMNGIAVFDGCSHLTIHDLYMTKLNGDGVRAGGSYTQSYMNIYNMQILSCGHDGVAVKAADNWKISNIICNLRTNCGVRFQNATNCELSYSTFYADIGSGDCGVEIPTGTDSNISIHHNIFHDMDSSSYRNGIWAHDCTLTGFNVYNNIFYNCPDGGIDAYTNTTISDCKIYYNIFDDNPFAVKISGGADIYNNIITDCSSYAINGGSAAYTTVRANNINGGTTTVSNATTSGTLTGSPGYNATSYQYIPLQSSAPLYSILSSWTSAGYQ